MFDNQRYVTRGVCEEIPFEFQLFMWECVDRMHEPKDYLQVFRLSNIDGIQRIQHTSEQPEYKKEYLLLTVSEVVTAKVYIIDDGEHCTMILAEEY